MPGSVVTGQSIMVLKQKRVSQSKIFVHVGYLAFGVCEAVD